MLLIFIPAILLLIGRSYYLLASAYHRNKWGYTFLGVGIFIASPVLFDFAARIFATFTGDSKWLAYSFTLFFLDMLFAFLTFIIVYTILRVKWERKMKKTYIKSDLLDR